jgi:hypothetical protein
VVVAVELTTASPPLTEKIFEGVVVAMPTLPSERIFKRSVPPVEKLRVSAAEDHIPVSRSLVNVYEGAPAEPPFTVSTDTERPLENVEVAAEVFRSEPPVIVRPLAAARLVPLMPPEKVLVAVPVFKIEPPVTLSPFAETRPPPATERPELAHVEVAVPEVWMVLVAVTPESETLPANSASP